MTRPALLALALIVGGCDDGPHHWVEETPGVFVDLGNPPSENPDPTPEEWKAWGCKWTGPDGQEIDFDPRPNHIDGGYQCRRPVRKN